MNNTIEKIIQVAKDACTEHGFPFIEIYQTRKDENVLDGWDRFIVSPVHVSSDDYIYIGFVRNDGTYVPYRPMTHPKCDGTP